MNRRRFVLTSLAGVLTAPLAAGAQQAGRVYRVGVLVTASRPDGQAFLGNTFGQEMHGAAPWRSGGGWPAHTQPWGGYSHSRGRW